MVFMFRDVRGIEEEIVNLMKLVKKV